LNFSKRQTEQSSHCKNASRMDIEGAIKFRSWLWTKLCPI